MNELEIAARALSIQKTLGTRRAAGFLRNRGFTLNAALSILGFPVRYRNKCNFFQFFAVGAK